LSSHAPGGAVRAVALVLHGGREASTSPVRPSQLAVLRMVPFAASLRRNGRAHGLAVARLRYVVRGWNGELRSPVADVRWALAQLTTRYPDVPVALVGHSMGGRAAVYAAGHPAVTTVAGLAPWIVADDPVDEVAGRHLLVMHGDEDRITDPRSSAAWVQRASAVTASAGYLTVRGERHAMLRRAPLWHALTTGYVLSVLCGVPPAEIVDRQLADVLAGVLAGQPSSVV
jgi:dienelactone hydrolase